MKVWMLSNINSSDSYERSRFEESAKEQNIDFDVVHNTELDLIVSFDDKKSIRYKSNIVELPDALLARTGSASGFFNLAVLRHFERLNVPTIPNSHAVEKALDKFQSCQIFSQHNLPIPKTMLARFPVETSLVKEQIGFPCVIKVNTGSHGAGVFLCENEKMFSDITEMIQSLNFKNSLMIQEYVSQSKGTDVRVIVIGGKVVGAMKRTATDDSFKANISRGGIGTPYDVSDELEMLALKTANVLDLDIAGIDLLFAEDGTYKICEANSAPGFKGFESALGISIPDKIFNYAKLIANKI